MKRNKQHGELAERGAAVLDKAVTSVSPYVEQAQAALAPALDEAKAGLGVAVSSVQENLLPKLNEMVHDATDAPATKEAVKRSRTAAAALRGEIEVSDDTLDKLANKRAKRAAKRNAAIRHELEAAAKVVTDEVAAARKKIEKKSAPQKSKKAKFGKFLLISVLLGAAAMVIKQLLAAKKEDPWQSYEPSTFSGPTSTPTPSAAAEATPPGGPAAEAPIDDTLAGAAVAEDASGEGDDTTLDDSADDDGGEPTEVIEAVTAAEPVAADSASQFGPGSYVGTEPPSGFEIKGNDRSMKYHLKGSESYDRTIADVWFDSPEAAEAAGFSAVQG